MTCKFFEMCPFFLGNVSFDEQKVYMGVVGKSRVSCIIGCQKLFTRFSMVGPTKVKACKSFVFTQKFRWLKKKHLFDFANCIICSTSDLFIIKELRMRR